MINADDRTKTPKVPSEWFLWGAMASMIGSLTLYALKPEKHASLFVGQWVPAFLLFGIYQKKVKVAASERPITRFARQDDDDFETDPEEKSDFFTH